VKGRILLPLAACKYDRLFHRDTEVLPNDLLDCMGPVLRVFFTRLPVDIFEALLVESLW
jgi:hypothetical protein